ncbi:MAG TPA: LPS assembly protein LptD [Rhodanobacteraceae bacterium]|nr:LPS assembly protein LptD [Rhodanobacteraceae bacterium]
MPTTARHPLGHRALAWAIAAAMAGAFAPTPAAAQQAQLPAHAPTHDDSGFTPCPLGTFNCPDRPVSYALCRPNALLEFYQPGLPEDSLGRESASTYIDAEHVDASNRSLYRLNGNVTLRRYDQLLNAEQLNYNDVTTAYDARGNVTYQDSAELLAASRIHGTTRPDYAIADHVQYQMLSSHGNGTAAQAELIDPQHSRFSQATYSTCDPGHRVWEFSAKKITTNKVTGVGVAHDATMRLGNVPFLYLPYFSFPIDNRRKSGFLYPTFANNGNSGFMFSIPYYLNLAPNYDATLTPQLYTERGLMLGGQFRYLFGSSRGQLDFDYLPNDQRAGSDHLNRERDIEDGADRYLIRFSDRTGLGQHWNFSTSIKQASDKYYFQDFESDLKGYTTPSSLASNAYIRGSGDWWSASLGVDRYQNIDPILSDSSLQYRRWPRTTFDLDIPLSRTLEFGMDNEAVAFRKDNVVEGNRVDLYPYLEANYQGAAWYVRPRVAWRYTAYELINDPAHYGYTDNHPSRSLPITSIDSGLIFERDTSLFGDHYTQTLEPRLYYLYVPYRDQSDLPTFDSREMTFAYWQLFTPNRFSGADRQMDANNLTAAVTTRLLDDGGVEKASFSFGQIHYFSPQKVQLGRHTPPTDFDGSDYVAQMSLSLSQAWRLNSVYQWDPNHRRTDVGTLQVQRRLGFDGVLNFSYRYRVNFMEQFDASAAIPVSENWRLLARWNVALRRRQTHWERGQPKTLAALLGLEYQNCCIAVRLIGRHYVRNVHGDTDNAVMFQIQFKGLGSFSPQTEDFLHHAILGYQ